MSKLVSLNCPNCNGKLEEEKKYLFCPYCGNNIKELVDNYYFTYNNEIKVDNATINVQASDNVESRLKSANTYMDKHHNYEEADKVLEGMEKYAADSPEFWWAKVRVVTNDLKYNSEKVLIKSNDYFLKYKNIIDREEELYKNNAKKYKKFILEKKTIIEKEIQECEKKIKNNTKNYQEKEIILKELNSKIRKKDSFSKKVIENFECFFGLITYFISPFIALVSLGSFIFYFSIKNGIVLTIAIISGIIFILIIIIYCIISNIKFRFENNLVDLINSKDKIETEIKKIKRNLIEEKNIYNKNITMVEKILTPIINII